MRQEFKKKKEKKAPSGTVHINHSFVLSFKISKYQGPRIQFEQSNA